MRNAYPYGKVMKPSQQSWLSCALMLTFVLRVEPIEDNLVPKPTAASGELAFLYA